MRYYPVLLDLNGKSAVVVGGGPVGRRKAESLALSGARVSVIAPTVAPELQRLADAGEIEHLKREYRAGDLEGAVIAVAATDNADVNRAVVEEAGRRGIPVNCATPPPAGSFIVPSSIHRSGLTLAISTGGISPALSKRLRKSVEEFIDTGYGPLLGFLAHARETLKARIPDTDRRRAILDELVNSDIVDRFLSDPDAALAIAEERLEGMICGPESLGLDLFSYKERR